MTKDGYVPLQTKLGRIGEKKAAKMMEKENFREKKTETMQKKLKMFFIKKVRTKSR